MKMKLENKIKAKKRREVSQNYKKDAKNKNSIWMMRKYEGNIQNQK